MSVRKRDDRNGRWYVDFVFEHATGRKERVKRVSPVNTKAGAQEYERQLRERLLNNGVLVDQSVLMRDFAVDYLKYQKSRVRTATYTNTSSVLEQYIVPFFGSMPLRNIGRRQVDEFSSWLQNDRLLKASTVNVVLSRFRAVMNLAVEWDMIDSAPRVKTLRVPERAPEFLTFEEAAILLDRAKRFRIAVWLALKAGLRFGEIQGLQWGDVDFRRNLLYIRRSRHDKRIGPTKSGRERCVDMPPALVDELKYCARGINPEDYVVLDENGRPATRGQMKNWLPRELFRLKIFHPGTTIGWHDLRHTYASHLVMRGVPLKVVSELLGHAQIAMTMVYAHLSPETKRDAVSLLDVPIASPSVFGIR